MDYKKIIQKESYVRFILCVGMQQHLFLLHIILGLSAV
jgi:hypothetical protein